MRVCVKGKIVKDWIFVRLNIFEVLLKFMFNDYCVLVLYVEYVLAY